MGTRKTVDGTATAVLTLRLPIWVLEIAEKEPAGARAFLRDIIIERLMQGTQARSEDQIGE